MLYIVEDWKYLGTPAVEEIIPFVRGRSTNSHINTDDILRKAAGVEQLSSHPAAQALLQKAEERKLRNLSIPTNFHEMSGVGVEGDIDGERIVVGSCSLFENIDNENYVIINDDIKRYMKNVLDTDKSLIQYDEGKMLALISINEKPAGVILFGDHIRPGITSMIQRLRNLGVGQTVMLTGDSFENAQKIAQQIGITYFESDLLPPRTESCVSE